MKTTELTDIDGDALTITQRLDATWITCTKGKKEVTIGPVPTDALRNTFQEPMGGDDMDGGVTAAAIEAEVVSPERARSLVQQRDELAEALDTTMGRAIKAERERDEALFRAEAARELFHGANLEIVAMRERAEKAEGERDNKAAAYDQMKFLFGSAERAALMWKVRSEKSRPLTADDVTDEMVERAALAEKFVPTTVSHKDLLRGILRAALSDPRPVYSPLLEDDLAAFLDTQEPDTDKGRADWLTARGWRKTGAES